MSRTRTPDAAVLTRVRALLSGAESKPLDLAELKRVMQLTDDALARRVFSVFDKDGSGTIAGSELVHAIDKLVHGTPDDKLDFVFRLHDSDKNGFIEPPELEHVLAMSLAQNQLALSGQEIRDLSNALFEKTDTDGDRKLSFDEFTAVMRAHPGVLNQLVLGESCWLTAASAPADDGLKQETKKRAPIQNAFWIGLFFAVNVLVFAWGLLKYEGQGFWLQVARGGGACLNLNGALILLPVSRRLMGWIRDRGANRLLPIDEALEFHKLVGHTIFALALVHTAAHLIRSQGLPMTKGGYTGLALFVLFGVMWFFSRAAIRRSGKFELFHFSHLLYVGFFALLLWHGPVFWKWAAVPIVLFVIDRVARRRGRRESTVVKAGLLASRVSRLDIAQPPGFSFRAADYVFLRIPAISRHEWHPFTISSAPEQPGTFSVHIRSAGNWTNAIFDHLEKTPKCLPLKVEIDGPYGTPSANAFGAQHVVLIGAGIGVTPFASILQSMLLSEKADTRYVHFVWVNRDQRSFEWFAELLGKLHARYPDTLEVHIYMTGAKSDLHSGLAELALDLMYAKTNVDLLTGLRTRTQLGHPNWKELLTGFRQGSRAARTEVFFCGPDGLAQSLAPLCAELEMPFHVERF